MIISKNLESRQWRKMINFDNTPRGNGTAFSAGTIFGWIYYLWSMLDLRTFGWEFITKLVSGAVSAVIIGLCVKVSLDYYEKKWKPRIFKEGKLKKPVI